MASVRLMVGCKPSSSVVQRRCSLCVVRGGFRHLFAFVCVFYRPAQSIARSIKQHD